MRDTESLTPEKIKAYEIALSDIPADALEAGLARCFRECVWFPTAPEIRERCGKSPQLAAEQSWEWLQVYIRRYWHPDIGHYRNAPEIPAAVDYAIRQCGGLDRIAYPLEKQADFVRKGFLEAHSRFESEGGEQSRMSKRLAAETLSRLQLSGGVDSRKALPESTETETPEQRAAVIEEIRRSRIPEHVSAAKGPEWEERLRKQADELKRLAGQEARV